MSWVNEPFLGLDFEATSPEPLTARIVQACVAYRSESDSGWTRDWLADAGGEEIPQGAVDIHGITTERAHTDGQPVIDVAEEVRELLQKAWANSVPVAGYNIAYDLTLLNAELLRAGHRELTIDGPVLDPLVMDRAADRYRKGSRKLGDVCRHYDVRHTSAGPGESTEGAAGAHDARADVLATLRVLWRIGQKYPDLAAMTAEDLHEWQATAHAAWAMHLQSYLRESGKEPNAVIDTAWPIRQAAVPA